MFYSPVLRPFVLKHKTYCRHFVSFVLLPCPQVSRRGRCLVPWPEPERRPNEQKSIKTNSCRRECRRCCTFPWRFEKLRGACPWTLAASGGPVSVLKPLGGADGSGPCLAWGGCLRPRGWSLGFAETAKKVPGPFSVLGRWSGAKRSGCAFRLRAWAFWGGKRSGPLSGLGSACLGSGCSGLCFFGGAEGPDPVSGLGGLVFLGEPKGPDPVSVLGQP